MSGFQRRSLLDSSHRFGRVVQVIGGCALLACGLGIALDFITANVAVEYFTVHHPQLVETANPWLLAILWGVAAAWWAGALGGILASFVNESRTQPLSPRTILQWAEVGCVTMWCIMVLVLIGVYFAAEMVPLNSRRDTFESDRRLMAVAMAHQYEYLLAIISALVIAFRIWRAK